MKDYSFCQGEKNCSSKLTAEQAKNIRDQRGPGFTAREQAARYKISVSTVKKIRARHLWKHLK